MSSSRRLDGVGPVTLSFTANMRYVRPVRHFICALCALASYDEEESESIALVATEILNNSIEHGAADDTDEIGLTVEVTPDRFSIEVLDPGRGGEGFASTALEKAAHMPDLEEPRGRGLFLIKSYMDEMDITYDPLVGTRLKVVKARKA